MDKKQHAKKITTRFLKGMALVINERILNIASKRAFALKIGLNPQDITLMENGTRYATLDNVYMLCKVFKFRTDWVILNSGETRETTTKAIELGISARLTKLEQKIEEMSKTSTTVAK